MAKHVIKFAAKRTFDATYNEWVDFVSRQKMVRLVRFHAAMHSDTSRLDTTEDIWTLKTSGKWFIFDFTLLEDIHFRQCIKWLTYKYLQSGSISVAYNAYLLLQAEVHGFDELDFSSLCKKLEFFNKQTETTPGYAKKFSHLKKIITMLVSSEAPTTDIEDLFQLEQFVLHYSIDVSGYYDMDVRLNPLELELIRTQSTHDTNPLYMARLTYVELRDLIVLMLCFQIGLRPIQVYRLSKNDFIAVLDKYFSIKRPIAKKGKKNEGLKGEDELQITPELGVAIQTLIERQTSSSKQLLQKEDGGDFVACTRYGVTKSINNTLQRWGAGEDFHKTAYDFRHNMAHTLTMHGISAELLAFTLGHSSLGAAKHYIAACPSIALIKEKALGRNSFYTGMIAMLTGDIALPKDWNGELVMAVIGSKLITGIGGCGTESCEYVPVESCYGCDDFAPFIDGNHEDVLAALEEDAQATIVVSDAAFQTKMNGAVGQREGQIHQVKQVIERCKQCKRKQA
jgi:hypothetical protein